MFERLREDVREIIKRDNKDACSYKGAESVEEYSVHICVHSLSPNKCFKS